MDFKRCDEIMTVQIQYHLKFPVTQVLFSKTELTFSINKIKSRLPSVLYFILHCYDMETDEDGKPVNEIYTYTSDRWVIGTVYEHRHTTFEIDSTLLDDFAYTQIELVTMGIDSENPLYFTECMLQEDEWEEYHTPNEVAQSWFVGFKTNTYANLYNNDGDYLQVIRPHKEAVHTDKLDKAEVTILAPHFEDDEDFDDDVAVFIEAMNQREQTIDVLR